MSTSKSEEESIHVWLRSELTKEEEKRRDDVIGAIVRKMPGRGNTIEAHVAKIKAQVIEMLLAEDEIPYVSASYFYWRMDYEAWKKHTPNSKSKFPWKGPRTHGNPYSFEFTKAFFDAQDKKKAYEKAYKAEQESKGQEKSKEKEQVAKPKFSRKGYYWNDDPKTKYHSPLAERERLYKELLGTSEYLPGCRPFEISVPSFYHKQYVGKDDSNLQEVISKTNLLVGGPRSGLKVFFDELRTPHWNTVYELRIFLDWPSTTDVEDLAWRMLLYHAWMGLLELHYEHLRGSRVDLVLHLEKHYKGIFNQHSNRFLRINARGHSHEKEEQARSKRLEEVLQKEEEEMRLLHRQVDYEYDLGLKTLRGNVNEKESFADKIAELELTVKDENVLYPLAIQRETRLAIARPVAEELLEDLTLDIHARYQLIKDKMTELVGALEDRQGIWGLYLTRKERYKSISYALRCIVDMKDDEEARKMLAEFKKWED